MDLEMAILYGVRVMKDLDVNNTDDINPIMRS